MEQSLWLANQKQVPAIRSYLLHSGHIRKYVRCTNYAKMLGHTHECLVCSSSNTNVQGPMLSTAWITLRVTHPPSCYLEEHFQSVTGFFFLQFCSVRGVRPVIIHKKISPNLAKLHKQKKKYDVFLKPWHTCWRHAAAYDLNMTISTFLFFSTKYSNFCVIFFP